MLGADEGGETISATAWSSIDRSVHADLRYLAPLTERPFIYCYLPPAGVQATNYARDVRRLEIRDARVMPAPTWPAEGLALLDWPVREAWFRDEATTRSLYIPEVEAMVRSVTGACAAAAFDLTFRKTIPSEESTTQCRPPVMQVHVDGVDHIARNYIRAAFPEQAAQWLAQRWQIINVWRSIAGPVLDTPLAFCDGAGLDRSQLRPTDLYFPDGRVGLTYQLSYEAWHRWRYFPELTASEAVMFKCYDSAPRASAQFVPHSAFDHPAATAATPVRQSLEVRVFACLGDG